MKKLFLISLVIVLACVARAQNYCVNDTIVREIQFPLTERDTETVFYYFNNEWIAGVDLDKMPTDSIQKMEVKNDEYGNRSLFLTVSPETLAQIKAEAGKILVNLDTRCEFPGGNGKLKEWIDENIRIPEGFKGSELVLVKFTVHPDGSISDPTIFRRPSKNEAVNQEALRLVKALPKFRVKYYVPHLKKSFSYYLPIKFKEPGAIFIRGDESK
ncbi:MAG: energy transducer TonB [Muribaculaceae bacterium]|nr:energy transducer TonB [Muribaculaceae bacterium]